MWWSASINHTAVPGWTRVLPLSIFDFVLSILRRFHIPLPNPKRWFVTSLLKNFLFVCLNSTSPCVVIPCLSRLLSLFTRASVLWLLPSCISSSWHLSAGCWLRRGSPTWQSLAKWGHDSFASGFCASAGVSPHSITRFKIVCSAVTVLKLSHLKVDEKNQYIINNRAYLNVQQYAKLV